MFDMHYEKSECMTCEKDPKAFVNLNFESEFMNFPLRHCKFMLSHYKVCTP